MRYYKSTSSREYMIDGKVIPSNKNNQWLAMMDNSIEKSPVIAALIKHGDVLVSDKEPADMSAVAVNNDNARLKLENEQLRQQLEEAQYKSSNTDELDQIKAEKAALEEEAKAELQKQADRIAELEKALAKAQKKGQKEE